MRSFRLFFLITVLVVTSGYRWRCWWACTDQTAIQNDYVENRDQCREYAQLKLDMVVRNKGRMDELGRKTELVNLFSDCMAQKGWDIPSGRTEEKAAATAAAAAATPEGKAALAEQEQQNKWALSRSAECAFARHAAANSRIAAARAQACDLECAQRLRNAPEAPRPAACPADADPTMATGVDREYDPGN